MRVKFPQILKIIWKKHGFGCRFDPGSRNGDIRNSKFFGLVKKTLLFTRPSPSEFCVRNKKFEPSPIFSGLLIY
jgi:hypothetical protein